ncbi:hypothetical protein [Paraburkholderia dilworthii]|uniref:hypothetical protein n=1 Tax=Paraburkholderia dilworthii TaxID=948106 RepID=UPI00126852FC|nr:hypothetical protein [Paraburkholderia dilworthii]
MARKIARDPSSSATSVSRLYALMIAGLNKDSPPSGKLLEACSTQEDLAKFCNPAEKIVAMSLNTLKRAADSTLGTDGWNKLNRLRIELRQTVQAAPKRLSPLQASRAHTRRVEDRIDRDYRARAVVYRAFLDAIALAREFSDQNPERLQKIARLQATFEADLAIKAIKEN